MAKKKKVNPRRIPLAKKEIDRDEILREASQDDIHHAWLLVSVSLLEQGYELDNLANAVDRYITNTSERNQEKDLRRAEALMGIPAPQVNLNISLVRSATDLCAYKKKVYNVCVYTALSLIFLGLESTGKFTLEELRRIFLNADLTRAEIESGKGSYDELEKDLAARIGESQT